MPRRFWFYRFYSFADFMKGILLLVVLHLLLLPFGIWAVQLYYFGHSLTFLVLVGGISLINIGVFIRATVMWLLRKE